MWLFIKSSINKGFNRDSIMDALCDGEVLGRYFPVESDEENDLLQKEVEEAYEEVSKWPERFVFRYRIGYRNGENEVFEIVEASTQDEAEDLVLEKHPSARIVWHECLGLANGTLEEVLDL
jgi:hypothetical protein